MSQLLFHPVRSQDFAVLAEHRRANASVDAFDEFSTMESLPDEDALAALADGTDHFEVIADESGPIGYCFIRQWLEDSGTLVVLGDWYCANSVSADHNRAILLHLERLAGGLVRSDGSRRTVIGMNASSVQPLRERAIVAAGYQHSFTQIEMQLTVGVPARPLPHPLIIREASVADAAALIALTRRVWAQRDFFTMPTIDSFEAWLRRSDLSLFHVGVHDDEIVAFVASKPHAGGAEIEDVQVDPAWQRRGIASALLAHNISSVRARGLQRVRLNTEDHDPAGARSLYERLGFSLVREYKRFRKPLLD